MSYFPRSFTFHDILLSSSVNPRIEINIEAAIPAVENVYVNFTCIHHIFFDSTIAYLDLVPDFAIAFEATSRNSSLTLPKPS